MSTHKTKFEDSRAEEFLNKYYQTQGIRVEPIGVGEESQAFYFCFEGEEYVLRISKHGKLEYLKDQIAYKEFSSEELPVPEVVDIGEVDDKFFFIITRRASGKTLDKFKQAEIEHLKLEIIKVLAAVHKLKVPGEGYGGWGLNRNGPFRTWNEYLLTSLDQGQDEIKDKTFYDGELHGRMRDKIREFIGYCPEERAILHGDFGTPNILGNDEGITALIDWGDSLYGDPLKDVAVLDSWYEGSGFAEGFRQNYQQNGGVPENFDERITCYKLLSTYSGLWFYAYSDQKESYESCAKRAKAILNQGL